MKRLNSWLIIFFLFSFLSSFGQITDTRFKELVREMNDPDDIDNKIMNGVIAYFMDVNNSAVFNNFVKHLEKDADGKNESFEVNLLYLRSFKQFAYNPAAGFQEMKPLLDQYLKMANETNNEKLIGKACWNYGARMYTYQQLELAATYCLKGIEVLEKEKKFDKLEYDLSTMGEILFRTREYRQSIYYTLKSSLISTDSILSRKNDAKNMNTIGQAYYQLGQLDSALFYYDLCDNKFEKLHYELWRGINASFVGQAYFDKKEYARAGRLLEYAYKSTINKENVIAGYSLSWLARVLIAEGRYDSAKALLNRSYQLLKNTVPDQELQIDNYLQQVYFAKAELFRATNNTDSFYYYTRQYFSLHDSLEHVATLSNSKISQLRISNEKNIFAIRFVQAEKNFELLKRNFIIVALACAAIIVIVVLRRQKKELQLKDELAQSQKKIFETEANAAKEQLGSFTQNLMEKNNLLEELQQQLSAKEFNQVQQQVITELSNQSILTEDDWTRFKNLFEKNYPSFFIKLKQAATDITIAEQRLAALTRLELTSKHMASMLGISVDSVYKTRQRLRQRINLGPEDNIDSFIADL